MATSAIAFFVFREQLSRRLSLAIGLVTLASAILSFEGAGAFRFDTGSALVLGAACCWGLKNNCTRMLSSKSSVQITTIKGIFSGLGILTVALVMGESIPGLVLIGAVLLLGFVAYGLSINFYIQAQASLGAATVLMVKACSTPTPIPTAPTRTSTITFTKRFPATTTGHKKAPLPAQKHYFEHKKSPGNNSSCGRGALRMFDDACRW